MYFHRNLKWLVLLVLFSFSCSERWILLNESRGIPPDECADITIIIKERPCIKDSKDDTGENSTGQ